MDELYEHRRSFGLGGMVTLLFLLLSGVGLANLYSAAPGALFNTQLRHSLVGLGAFIFFARVFPITQLIIFSYPIFLLNVVSLVLVLVAGYKAGGAQRWLSFAGVTIQPSEFMKLSIVLMIAHFFYNNRGKQEYTIVDIGVLILQVLLVFVLIFKQPDFGTAGVCLAIACAQLMFIRLRISFRAIFIMILGAFTTASVGWFFLLRPYQKLRILNLLNPDLDPSGSGYNSLQSLVAVGSGGQWGKGFMHGTQNQLQFLPARHTDFIFSVFAEEHGLSGCVGVFSGIVLLCLTGLSIARGAKDSFASIAAVGICALIFIEFSLNTAMVLAMFPVVGMPLPFFSYGGSSLITIASACGMLVGIDRYTKKQG